VVKAASLSLLLVVAAHAAPDAPAPLYVTAGAVHVGTGQVFRPGAVSIVDGKIAAVGKPDDVAVPPGARRIDGGPRSSVVPGLVAAQTEHLAKGDEDPNSVAPDVRAIDGYDFAAPETKLLSAGVTTVFLSPGSNRVVTGRGAVVKTAGASRETRTLRADAGLVAGIGESVAHPPPVIDPPVEPDATKAPLSPWRRQFPVTRAGALMLLRELFDAQKPADGTPIRIAADSAGDIDAAIAFAQERQVPAVLVGCRDAGATASAIAKSSFPVVLRWPMPSGRVNAGWDADHEKSLLAARRNPAVLAAATPGVTFALAASEESSLPDLLFVAASAAREGLAPSRAVAAITSDAAKILGVGDRVGSLEAGRDGDLVLLSGSPTDLATFALTTVVDGAVVWERKAAGRTVVVRAATVHLGDGRVLAPGEVAFENGKIVEVGPSVGVPPGARFIDVGRGSVAPGFIDAYSHAGLAGEGGRPAGDLSTAVTTAKALSANDESFAMLASQGVTTALVAPGDGGRVAGRASIVKTSGADMAKRLVDDDAALVVRLRGDRDVAAASKELDDLLKKAKEYKESWEKYEKDKKEYDAWKKAKDEEDAKKKAAEAAKAKEEPKKDEPKKDDAKKDEPKASDAPPDKPAEKPPEKPAEKKDEKPADEKEEPKKPKTDEALAGWLPALEKKVPVFVQARSVEEIRAAIALIVDQWKLRLVLVGADDARHVAAAIEKAKAGVIASPVAMTEEKGRPVNLLRELSMTGLPEAIGSDSWLGGAELRDVLAYAVARGLSPTNAVRLVTGDAAKLLGVESRVGAIAVGKDADLVLFTGEPFGEGSSIRAVFVGGEEVGR
jgi:imidazolonepropionase-like amidohydrolase